MLLTLRFGVHFKSNRFSKKMRDAEIASNVFWTFVSVKSNLSKKHQKTQKGPNWFHACIDDASTQPIFSSIFKKMRDDEITRFKCWT